MMSAVYDIYMIGDSAGFYVGHAKRLSKGGWQRRVKEHRCGRGNRGARRLLLADAPCRCVGSVHASRTYAVTLEAHLWEVRKAHGWLPVHTRPTDVGFFSTKGLPLSAEHRAKISAARSGRPRAPFSVEHRAKLSAAGRGRKHLAETCAKISEALQGRVLSVEHRAKISNASCNPSAETRAKIGAANRGREPSPEHRAKISAANRGKKRSQETRAKMVAAAQHRSVERYEKISATLRGRQFSAETRAKMSRAQRNRAPFPDEHRARISAAKLGKALSSDHRARIAIAVGRGPDGRFV